MFTPSAPPGPNLKCAQEYCSVCKKHKVTHLGAALECNGLSETYVTLYPKVVYHAV